MADDTPLRIPFRLADIGRRVHAVGLLADAGGVLVDGAHLRPELPLARNRHHAKKLVRTLSDGSISVLAAATTCATAGIIVGVVALTGLGLKFSSIVIAYAGGSLLLTAIYTALIVWIVGLAVPVTASYIICAVIAAPAMIKLGVPDVAAHMFIFYYSVLSEVSPPTALSPFAAAAITGGDPYKTTLQACDARCRPSSCRSCSCSIRRASDCCSSFRRTDPGSTSSDHRQDRAWIGGARRRRARLGIRKRPRPSA